MFILALLWTRRWFTRQEFLHFLTDTSASHPIDLSTLGRQDLSRNLCTVSSLPRQTSARRHDAAPSFPQRRTTRPPGSSCHPSCNLITKFLVITDLHLHLVSNILLIWPTRPTKLVSLYLLFCHKFCPSSNSFVSMFCFICHILFMMCCERPISFSMDSMYSPSTRSNFRSNS